MIKTFGEWAIGAVKSEKIIKLESTRTSVKHEMRYLVQRNRCVA